MSKKINEGQRYADSIFAVFELYSRMSGEYESVEQQGRRLVNESHVVELYQTIKKQTTQSYTAIGTVGSINTNTNNNNNNR